MNSYAVPEIFNTDQGSQFTGQDFTQALKDAGIAISMDGKVRWTTSELGQEVSGELS